MKICAIICEYNPFHNGHLYQLEQARRMTDSDFVVCFMSGNFVQRGEAAVLDKYIRARHAVLAGADAVIELPVVFASSSAELFAKGAIKLITSVPNISALCFGAEIDDAAEFRAAAKALDDEPQTVSQNIRERMKNGESYIRARAEAWKSAGLFDGNILTAPNNILGVEYTRALNFFRKDVEIFPLKRIGRGYSDLTPDADFPSSSALRNAIYRGERPSKGIPDFVREDLPHKLSDNLETLEKFSLIKRSEKELRGVLDCTEGLEYALKKAARQNVPDLVTALTSKRYTSSRIRRILLQNLLNITEDFIRECLREPLYLRLLAVKENRKEILSELGFSELPLLIRAGDSQKPENTAKKCLDTEMFADEIFRLVRDISEKKNSVFL